jgi:hypothetical protein
MNCHTSGQVPSGGLTAAEAARRLKECGYNELPEERENPLLKFLSYF